MTKVFGIDLVSISACAQVSALADGAVVAAVEFIAGKLGTAPTLEVWEAIRVEWRGAYMDQRGLDPADKKTANALDVAWSRNVVSVLSEQYGLTKPKAATATATAKAEQRKKPDIVENAQTVAELDKIKLPSDVVEAAKLAKAISDKRLSLVKMEARAELRAKQDANKAKRDAFIAFFKELAPADQELFYALKDKRFGVVMAHIPRAQIVDALSVMDKVVDGKPAKPSKPAKLKPALV